MWCNFRYSWKYICSRKTISFLKKLRVDGYVILGDVVNYLPWSNECIDILINLEHKFLILGNHEEYFLKVSEPINPIVKKFLDINLKNFTRYSALKISKNLLRLMSLLLSYY